MNISKPVAGVAAVALLAAGYFVGREHIKYEIRERMRETLSAFGAPSSSPPSPVITSAPTAPSQPKSPWITNTDTDPLSDASIYTAIVRAVEGKGAYGGTITLIVRCKDNRTEMFINWGSYLGSDDKVVTYRVGKEPAITNSWSLSTDSRATFLRNPIPVLSQFEAAETFVANITPYNSNPITAVFDITGAKEALADIRSGCNW